MFLSRLRVLSFSSPRVLIKTTLYVCGGGFFLSLTKNSSKRQKHTKLSSDRHILLFGSVRCLHYVCLFLFDHPVDVNKGTISFRVRLVSRCCDRRKTSPRSRGERGGRLYTLFARQKKKAPSFLPPLLLLSSCDLFFFITTYELYSRGLLGLLLFCSFIAFSWFKPSSRRRREESSSLVDPFSLFHSHALSFITLKKQAPSRSVDRSLLQTEDTHNLFSYIFWIK
jgi:hypothetical protein